MANARKAFTSGKVKENLHFNPLCLIGMKSEKMKSTENVSKILRKDYTLNTKRSRARSIHAKHTTNALSNDMQMQDGIVEYFRNCE